MTYQEDSRCRDFWARKKYRTGNEIELKMKSCSVNAAEWGFHNLKDIRNACSYHYTRMHLCRKVLLQAKAYRI